MKKYLSRCRQMNLYYHENLHIRNENENVINIYFGDIQGVFK